MRKRAEDVVLTERLDQGKLRGEIRVFMSNSGRYIAEYKLGTVKWQVPMSGRTAIEAMTNAKKWLTTSMGSRSDKPSHATMKSTVPGIAKWDMSAGGTGAAAGKHGYSYRSGIKGEYHIFPYTTKYGRHAGYALKYAATGGPPRGSHSGLWHELGTFKSPASAAKAAREHYAKSFE